MYFHVTNEGALASSHGFDFASEILCRRSGGGSLIQYYLERDADSEIHQEGIDEDLPTLLRPFSWERSSFSLAPISSWRWPASEQALSWCLSWPLERWLLPEAQQQQQVPRQAYSELQRLRASWLRVAFRICVVSGSFRLLSPLFVP